MDRWSFDLKNYNLKNNNAKQNLFISWWKVHIFFWVNLQEKLVSILDQNFEILYVLQMIHSYLHKIFFIIWNALHKTRFDLLYSLVSVLLFCWKEQICINKCISHVSLVSIALITNVIILHSSINKREL